MDDGAQDLDVADDDVSVDSDAPRRGGIARWLFERRPERGARDETTGAKHAAEVPSTQPDPEADPVADEPEPAAAEERAVAEADTAGVEPEPGPEDAQAEHEPEHEPEPEREPEPTAAAAVEPPVGAGADSPDQPEDEPADEPVDEPVDLRKARPRPSGSAPKIYEPAASTATEPQAGDSFFNRPIDADDDKWHRDADKDEARAEREDKRKQRRAAIGSGLRTLRKVAIIAAVVVVAALLLRSYVVAPYYVPSASMEPTLHGCPGCNNDHVLVEKLSYRFHDVQAGDIIVFNNPETGGWKSLTGDNVLIKRVIGVAGDKITVKNGHVYRNGQVLSEPYVNTKCKDGTTVVPGGPRSASRTWPTIPNGKVFVMGDNRCDSDDSRVNGDVPTDKVIGRAFMIIYPFGRIHSL